MQTFLPYSNFKKSAQVLDYRRLGKQRIEAKQILAILLNETPDSRWAEHKAVQIWKGYENALALYGMTMCVEWQRRYYEDNTLPYFMDRILDVIATMPSWLGNEEFHRSHRSNLMKKNFNHYSQYFIETSDLPYIWPKNENN